jgi:hypothetical protein
MVRRDVKRVQEPQKQTEKVRAAGLQDYHKHGQSMMKQDNKRQRSLHKTDPTIAAAEFIEKD